jgi:histidine triad (HIT) family protein
MGTVALRTRGANMSDQCIFCQIINKELPANIVFEDDELIVFHDINPQAPAHLLIVPKIHHPSLNDITPEQAYIFGRILVVAKTLAEEFGLTESGWRMVINCGADAKQTVFHVHVHLLGGRPMVGQMA